MNEKKKGVLNGPGFYIALCCCVIAIGMAGYFTSRNDVIDNNSSNSQENSIMYATQKPQLQEPTPIPQTDNQNTQENNNTSENSEVKSESKAVSANLENQTEDNTPTTSSEENYDVAENGEPREFYDSNVVDAVSVNPIPKFISPVDGNVTEGFSDGGLVYNNAMGDWRTHNGIDIAAPQNSSVLACADGVIEQVFVDSLGNTVIIDHKNGYRSRYSNLDNIDNIQVGTEVTQGSVLGKVGTYSLGENTTEPHIHFEIIMGDKYLNPEELINQ